MQEFQGKKFRYTNTTTTIDNFGCTIEKKNFAMTKQYVDYCEQKRLEKEYGELRTMKERLEYQLSEHGEVDEVDFNEYIHKLTKLGQQHNSQPKGRYNLHSRLAS